MKLVLATMMFISSIAMAAPECTTQPRESWLKVEEMKKKAELLGYKIKTFKTLEHCYEIYGTDKDGKKAEVYFNPVDGSIVKAK